jgi:hypothetical protein
MRKIVPTILALIGTAAAVAILTVATVTRAPAPVTFTAPTVTTEAPTGDDLAFPTVDQVARYNGRTVTPSPGFDGRMLARKVLYSSACSVLQKPTNVGRGARW